MDGLVIWAQWWAWMALGLVFGILEILLPSYIFVGFSSGAIVVGVLLLLGLMGGSLPWLLVVFAIASLVSILGLRLTLGSPVRRAKVWTTDIND